MHVTAPTDALRAAVKACAAAVSAKPTNPVLAGVHLTASEDGPLTLRGFDYETEVTAAVNVRTTEPGAALVSHRLLTQILTVASAATVDLGVDSGRLVVTAGRATWRLPLLHADDYPNPTVPVAASGTVAADAFRDAVDTAASAAKDTPTVDPALHVVGLELGDQLAVVGTDSYRLHSTILDWDNTSQDTVTVLVPAQKLLTMVKALDPGEATMFTWGVGSDGNRVTVTDGATTLTTSLVSAGSGWVTWRNHLSRVNSTTPIVYVFDRAELLTAVKQAVPVAERLDKQTRHIALHVRPGECTVAAASAEDGDSSIPVSVEYEGDPLRVTVNAEYLTTALNGLGHDRVQFAQAQPKSPLGLGGPKQPATHVVMPIMPECGWGE